MDVDVIAESLDPQPMSTDVPTTVNELDIANTPSNVSNDYSKTSRGSTSKTKRTKKRRQQKGSEDTKRIRGKPFDRPEVPYGSTLPAVVWVFDALYQWWPGKIDLKSRKGNIVTVVRFGNIKPKSLDVTDPSESTIIPFVHTSKTDLQKQGSISQHSVAFKKAYEEAVEAQLTDDEGLPDDIASHIFASKPATIQSLLVHSTTRNGVANIPSGKKYEQFEETNSSDTV
ncbi:hypothetical protein BG004_007272, partial [Podila humilis]